VQVNCFWNRNTTYYQSSWRGTKDLDGGTLFTQFSHFVDLLYWFLGEVKDVHGFVSNSAHQNVIETEDTGVFSFKTRSGVMGTFHYTTNAFQKNMEGSITVFGEKGTVKVGGQYLNVLEHQCIENYVMNVPIETKPANDYGYYQGSMSNHDSVYENIIDVLTNNGHVATNGLEGLKTVEIIENIYKLAKSNNG
jgi:predicted dehydrogenase